MWPMFVPLQPPYEELKELEEDLRRKNALTFDTIFREPTGYYLIKCFLVADYSVDKAVFIHDVDVYKTMRDPQARAKVCVGFSVVL